MSVVRMAVLIFSACCLVRFELRAQDQSGQQSADRIDQLIASLGSDDFTLRELSAEELKQIGAAAVTALQAATIHPDREIRFRSQRVLGLIRQDDLEQRLEAFLRGKASADEFRLPGWNRFRKSYGDSPKSRSLFVEMQRSDAALLAALEDGPRPAVALLGRRMSQYQQSLQSGVEQLALGQIAAALFVAAEEDVEVPMQTLMTLFNQCHQAAFRDALADSARQQIPRKMLGAVIRRSEDFAAYPAMTVAYQYNLPEGVFAAEKILRNKGPKHSAHMSQYALMTVARLGNASHLPLVEKLLSDTSLVSRMQEEQAIYDVQLRDAALAAAIMLSGQDLKTYFDIPANLATSDPQIIFFNARIIGFASEEKRAAVFAKWAAYKAQASSRESRK